MKTVIDNGKFQRYLTKEDLKYTKVLWNAWIKDGTTQAELVPGAKKFIQRIEDLGATVIYLSNRPETYEGRDATIKTLKNLGVETDGLADPKTLRLLLKREDESDKEPRRALVREQYLVVALIGDNLGDFSNDYDKKKAASIPDRPRAGFD